jgi:hypothetical protein
MNLHTIGCSFTYAQQRGWPKILADKINFKLENKGRPGAGNTYIGNAPQLDSVFIKNPPTWLLLCGAD